MYIFPVELTHEQDRQPYPVDSYFYYICDHTYIQTRATAIIILMLLHHNGKSLSWMGITRERWCCTRGLVSRLDMNTCQTSIETDVLL